MRFAFKTKKSAGVRVTAAVHRLIGVGNAARDAGRWVEAAIAYGEALDQAPGLSHIHLQRGHALKQAERPDEADAAYAEAARLRPGDVEPLVHRADLARRLGRQYVGPRLLAMALAQRPGHPALENELIRMIAPVAAIPARLLRELLENGWAPGPVSSPAGEGGIARLFDISDLIGHFRHQRLPNGIERVQIEVITHMLDTHGDGAIGLCGFIVPRDGWVGVPPALFRELAHLATTGSEPADPDWQRARARLFLHLAVADEYVMPTGAVLLNLGTSWWSYDYFRHLRNARVRAGIRYIPFVYDLIPVVAGQYCAPAIVSDFIGWVVGALSHADGFMTISHHSRDDLLHVAERLGRPLAAERVDVIRLDADFRRSVDPLPAAALAAWDLTDTPFALLVSTIEPRKNHALALDAWSALLRRHGSEQVPRLVCVGRDGRLSDPVFARLALDPLLAAHVTLIPRVSDAELALLYHACRLTVYPSLYEGWGLPVTESLCHGRIAIVADSSSLPEAGGEFALMFKSGSLSALVAAVEQVIFDDHWRLTREAAIATRFVPRTWAQVADQIDRAVTRLLAAAEPVAATPELSRGLYYPTIVQHGSRLPADPIGGEDVRIGDGWLWPEPDGCRTAPAGGLIRIGVRGSGPLRVHFRLRGLAAADCPVSLTIEGRETARMIIPAGKIRWLACDMAGPDLSVVLRGEAAETVEMPNGPRVASVTLLGLLPVDPDAPSAALLAAIDGVFEQPPV